MNLKNTHREEGFSCFLHGNFSPGAVDRWEEKEEKEGGGGEHTAASDASATDGVSEWWDKKLMVVTAR